MASPASIPFDHNHPSYPYDLYVEEEAARYEAALQFRTANLAKRNKHYGPNRPVLKTRPNPYPNLDKELPAYHATLKATDAAPPAPVYKPFVQPPETYVIPPYKGTYSSRSEEWGSNNKGPTNPVKFYADKVNLAHKQYLANELTSEDYLSEVFEYLEDRASSDDVFGFLHTIMDKLEAGTFCPEDAKTRFSTKLNSCWKAHCANEGISGSEDVEEEREEAIADDPAPIIGCKATVSVGEKSIRAAYDNYVAKVPDAETHLLGLSLAYVRRTIRLCMSNCAEGMDDFEDVASHVAEKIWKSLPTFNGDSLAYFKWLNVTQKNAGIDGVRKVRRETDSNVPLMVEYEDGELEQNPLIDRQRKQEYVRELPDWIQGNNLWICMLLREGMSYAQIAKSRGMTEKAVKECAAKMRKRNLEETKASGVVKRIRVRGGMDRRHL